MNSRIIREKLAGAVIADEGKTRWAWCGRAVARCEPSSAAGTPVRAAMFSPTRQGFSVDPMCISASFLAVPGCGCAICNARTDRDLSPLAASSPRPLALRRVRAACVRFSRGKG
jgi:hypothetical protein